MRNGLQAGVEDDEGVEEGEERERNLALLGSLAFIAVEADTERPVAVVGPSSNAESDVLVIGSAGFSIERRSSSQLIRPMAASHSRKRHHQQTDPGP